jgi:cell division initiation protein
VKLTSQVIKNKEFRKGVRGYSQEEVEEFLGIIAQDYDTATNEIEMLQAKASSIEANLANYAKMENALQTTLVLAQEAAVQMKEKANSESGRIIREANETVMIAQQEAEQILEAAQAQADRLNSQAREAAAAANETVEQTLAKANYDAESILAEANEAALVTQRKVEELIEKANSESEAIKKAADEYAKQIMDKAKRDVLFIIDEFDATKGEYTDFRLKFKEFMKLQMDTFDEMDKEFVKHYEELQDTIPGAEAKEEKEEASEDENFDDIKSFFEAEHVSASTDRAAAEEAENFEDIQNFFGKEKEIEEYKRTNNS